MKPMNTNTHTEDEYFFKEDQEKLRRLREQLDRERAEREAKQQRELHWLKCPKCGSSMREVLLKGIYVEQCSGCRGVFFDQGEWNLLIDKDEKKPSFFTTLHSLLVGDGRL